MNKILPTFIKDISITYIFHDCFIIESPSAVFVFDFWRDPLNRYAGKASPPIVEELNASKGIYIFVSHHHKDHFTRSVFSWQQKIPTIKYIISNDVFKTIRYMFKPDSIYTGYRPLPASVCVLNRGEIFDDGFIRVKAFGSTDIGNSYAIEADDKKIFHAGDLNAWLWLDESTEAEIRKARGDYKVIVKEISASYPALDIVMFPVDPRMGIGYEWGADYFISHIKTDIFVPMHFELGESGDERARYLIGVSRFGKTASAKVGTYLMLSGSRSTFIK